MNKSLLERLLDYYQLSYEDYLKITSSTSLASFSDGHQFDDIDKAVNLVKSHINKKSKIIIYGDYDADGIMGTSILVKMFQYLDVVVDYYIPNRYIDGYGLNLAHAQEYIKSKYDLVITVDNGITAFEPIDLLRNSGVDVLILDHHQTQDIVPNANAICHPIYSHFGETSSSGAFTAFMFSISLLNRVDKYLAILASISLISDMMPLKEYNRNLLRSVFAIYKSGEYLALDLLGDNEEFNESLIGMKIAPRINSIGRLCEDLSISEIVKYFVSDDKDFILSYYSHILEMNDARKMLSKEEIDESSISPTDKAIILKGNYKEGIIGLVANSIMNKYKLPTVIFTKSNDGNLKGSARAPEGFDIVETFNELGDILLTSGGHSMAGGCSILEKDFDTFKKRFQDLAENKPLKKVEHQTIEIGMSELILENYELIHSFSPFGEAWPNPLFKLRHIKVDSLTYSRDHNHIITSLGNKLKIVYFYYPKEELENLKFVDFIGVINKKEYRGLIYLEFAVKEMKPSK